VGVVTSQGLVSDGQARRLAIESVFPNPHRKSAAAKFSATGEIVPLFAQWGRSNLPYRPRRGKVRMEYALAAYVAFHGERGPVEGWSSC
jgi:hypothetical protein